MPTDGKTQAYGFLDQLSVEELLDLVRADFESSKGGDSALTARILEVIEEREKIQPTGLLSDAGRAWEDFQTYYSNPDSPDDTDCSLYPMRDSDLMAVMTAGETPDKPSGRGHGRLLKRVMPLAAVLAAGFFCMVAAQAMGMDVFGALARWTDETFHFVTDTVTDTTPEAENLRQAVQGAFDSCGITIPAPAWYPEDTKLSRDIDLTENSKYSAVVCNFIYGSGDFSIMAQQYSQGERVADYTFEKDALNVEEYSSNGRLFYIMSNLPDSRAVYSTGQTLLVINGQLSSELLKQIIDSIGE